MMVYTLGGLELRADIAPTLLEARRLLVVARTDVGLLTSNFL